MKSFIPFLLLGVALAIPAPSSINEPREAIAIPEGDNPSVAVGDNEVELARAGRCPNNKFFEGSKQGLEQCRRKCRANGGTCKASFGVTNYQCKCRKPGNKPREAIAIPEGDNPPVAVTGDKVEVAAAEKCPNKKHYKTRKECVRKCEKKEGGSGICYNSFDFTDYVCECKKPGGV